MMSAVKMSREKQRSWSEVNVLLCVFVSDGDSAQDVSDFNWDDYLEETGALSVPHHAFKHVGPSVPSSHLANFGLIFESCVQLNSISQCD